MRQDLTWTQLKWVFFIFILIMFAGLVILLFVDRRSRPPAIVTDPLLSPSVDGLGIPPVLVTPLPIVSPQPIAPSITLAVPFLVQAPFAVWDALHEEACEEASLIMVKFFLDDKPTPDREAADKEITDLVAYQTENGYAPDVTIEQLAAIAKSYYGMTTGRIENNITVPRIKEEIAAGRPVIVPAAGKILPNPYFTAGGPDYHMLVIIGYDTNGFITNDPGTRRGQYFHYKYDELLNAIHDWNDGKNILDGPKQYLVFD